MKLKLLDYQNKPHEFEIGDLDKIIDISLEVITGDEVGIVLYKDGNTKMYDTGSTRAFDFADDFYIVYNESINVNLLNDEKWLNRKDSYRDLFGDDEK